MIPCFIYGHPATLSFGTCTVVSATWYSFHVNLLVRHHPRFGAPCLWISGRHLYGNLFGALKFERKRNENWQICPSLKENQVNHCLLDLLRFRFSSPCCSVTLETFSLQPLNKGPHFDVGHKLTKSSPPTCTALHLENWDSGKNHTGDPQQPLME